MDWENQTGKIPEVFAKTVHHFFPKIGKWSWQIQDHRQANIIDYKLPITMF